MAANPPVLRIPLGVEPSAPELNRRCTQLSDSLVQVVEQLNLRQTTSEIGRYAQVQDVASDYGDDAYSGPLLTADNYRAGDHYHLTENGRFSTDIAELGGLDAVIGDTIISDGELWELRTGRGAYLSRLEDDTALGTITLSAGGKSLTVPVEDDDLARLIDIVTAIVAHEAAANPHPQYLRDIDTADFARLSVSNTFSSGGRDGQIICSDGPDGRPGIRLAEYPECNVVAELYYNQQGDERRVNLNAYRDLVTGLRRMLYLQNYDEGQKDNIGSVVIGDNVTMDQFDRGGGTLVVEDDVWIKDEVSLARIWRIVKEGGDGELARLTANNVFLQPNQAIRSRSTTDVPGWQLLQSDGTLKFDVAFNEGTDTVRLLARSGSRLRIQPGAATGAEVGEPTVIAGPGEMRAQASVYADSDQELMRESDALQVFAFAAYGALRTTAAIGLSNITVGTWQTVPHDAVSPAVPRAVIPDPVSDTITFEREGVYQLFVSGSLAHNESNQARRLLFRFYNVTAAAPGVTEFREYPGRNQLGTNINILGFVEIAAAQVNSKWRLEVTSDLGTFSSVDWLGTFGATNVGEWREPLPSDAP